MFNYGSQVNPALGRSDFGGILQGQMQANQSMLQGAQAQANAYSNIGKSIAGGIDQYQKNQDFIGKALGQFSGVQNTFGDDFSKSIANAPKEVADAVNKLSSGKSMGTKEAAMLATFASTYKDAKAEESLMRQRDLQTKLAQEDANIARGNSAALAKTLAEFSGGPDLKQAILAGGKFEDLAGAAKKSNPNLNAVLSSYLKNGGELGRGNGMDHVVKAFQMLAPAERSNEYASAGEASSAIAALPKNQGMNWTVKYNEKTGKYFTEQVNAPAGTTVNLGDNMDKTVFDSLLKQREATQGVVDNMPMMNSIGETLKSGNVFTGTGASQKLSVAKLLSAAGVGNFDSEIKATETYKSMIGQSIIPGLQALGRNPTDKDLKFMLDVKGGAIELNQDTLVEINRIAQNMAKEAAAKHNKRVQDVFGGDSPTDNKARTALLVDIGGISAKPTGGAMQTQAAPAPAGGATKMWVRDSNGKLIQK